jgi:hypothetical protein
MLKGDVLQPWAWKIGPSTNGFQTMPIPASCAIASMRMALRYE